MDALAMMGVASLSLYVDHHQQNADKRISAASTVGGIQSSEGKEAEL
jgi:hypothetical protein